MSVSIERGMLNLLVDLQSEMIEACARAYGFSSLDAKSRIGNVVLLYSGGVEKKALRKEMLVSEKRKLALPFSGAVEEGCCHGLKQNHGLLSQCANEVSSGYCSGCNKQCEKNASGKPDCGNIEDRMTAFQAGVEFRDPKGRSPVAYAKVMQKLKITEEEVLAEVAKFNVTFNREHFAMPESKRGRPKKEGSKDTDSDAESKKRGRPKKALKAVEVSSTEDLFATLISEVKASSPRAEVQVQVPVAVLEVTSKKEKDVTAKEATKATKEAEKAAAKATKEAEKLAAKAAKEQEKLAAKALKDQEKLAAKASKDKKEKAVPVPMSVPVPVPVPVPAPVEEEEEEELVVTKFEFKGKTYLRTKANVLYDATTQDCVGVFNDSLQVIEECELEEESEVEESDEEEDS
jgi:hypothetical protein